MARNFDLGQFRALVDHPGIENTPVFARPISGHPPYSGSIAAHRPASRKHWDTDSTELLQEGTCRIGEFRLQEPCLSFCTAPPCWIASTQV